MKINWKYVYITLICLLSVAAAVGFFQASKTTSKSFEVARRQLQADSKAKQVSIDALIETARNADQTISNLQAQLNKIRVEPATSEQELAASEQKAAKVAQKQRSEQTIEKQRAQYLASLRVTNQLIQVIAVLDAFGQCQTSVGYVYLIGLPASVSDYLKRYNQLKLDVANYAVQVKNLARAADRANAVVPTGFSGDAAYVNALAAQRHQVNNMALDAKDAAQNLTEMKTTLAQWQDDLVKNTTVVAYPNGKQYCGLLLWQYVGPGGYFQQNGVWHPY